MRYVLLLAFICGFISLVTDGEARAEGPPLANAPVGDAIPAAGYFPILPFDATEDTPPQLIPVASNHPMDAGPHPGISRAIIIIHDEMRDANGAMASISTLAGNANAGVMIIAPQFLLPSDLARFATHLPEEGRLFATWQADDWPIGGDSQTKPPQKPTSSFTAVDLLLMYLSDRSAFPDMHTIIVAGFGGGGNFVQRYAAFTAAAQVIEAQNIDLRFLVAGATSYMYLTANRPLGGRRGFGRPDASVCPDYNTYPYGLDKMVPYARHTGGNAAKISYGIRFITYLNASGGDMFPDTHCAALVQGAASTSRTENLHAYLMSLYSDVLGHTQTFVEPKDAKNDAVGLFGSACGMATLFGDGLCASSFSGASQ